MRFLRLALVVMSTLVSVSCANSASQIPAESETVNRVVLPSAMHDKWTQKSPLPTAVLLPAVGAVGTKIYVAGGATAAKVATSKLMIYDTATDTWSTGAPMHTPRWDLSSGAVVNGIFYVIGGAVSLSKFTRAVEAYDPATNAWSRKAPMPVANAPVVAVSGTSIYAIGGYDTTSNQRLATVYRYDTVADTWTKRASMHDGRSNPGVGTIGTTIVAADGLDNAGVTTDNEAYGVTRNAWVTKAPGLTATTGPCFGAIGGKLFVAGGEAGAASAPALNILDAYTLQANSWVSKATMPQAVVGPGSAVFNGKLFCFGGASSGNPRQGGVTFYSNVQVYQP
jgi:N-acetylneuraminic acid mutarotase